MRDTLVAVDAGLAALGDPGGERGGVRVGGALALAREVHADELVAVAALARVVGLHALPLPAGELQALGDELLARVDGAEDPAPHFLRGLHLARDLVRQLGRATVR